MWGVFEVDDRIHVAPSDGTYMLPDHTMDDFCNCDPYFELGEDGRIIVVHEQVN